MIQKPLVRAVVAPCPDCGEDIALRGTLRVGKQVTCPHCEAELKIIEIDPVELDWTYDDDDSDENEDEDY